MPLPRPSLIAPLLGLSLLAFTSGGRAQPADAQPDPKPAVHPADAAEHPQPSAADAAESAQNPDDPEAQQSLDKSAAELEAVRRAEQKAGLIPAAPGKGPLDGLAVGLGAFDPVARDLAAALGSSIDGAPCADPVPAFGTAVSLPELAGISAEELRAKYDIPVEINDAVVAYVRFFQTDAREPFAKWLGRAARWQPIMRTLLEQNGAPLDLVYLSMIESGYNPYAYSFAKAAGLWQFVVGTSRRYGLTTDFWVDERRDPIRSTEAAARYLADLNGRFHGDWYLAWAGYNAGEGKVEKAIRKDNTVDFWRMMTRGRTLRAETKHYVPKLIAAALIAKHPERFGFHVEGEGPFDYDVAEVPGATSLAALAKAAGTTVEVMHALNPALRRFCTPPSGWSVRLPKGSKDAFTEAFARLGPAERLAFTQHKIEKGDSLGRLAKAYGISEAVILRTNGMTKPKEAKVGRVLVIPLQATRGLAAGESLEERTRKNQGRTLREPGKARAVTATPSANYALVQRAREKALAEGKADPADVADDRQAKLAAAQGKGRAEQAKARVAAGAKTALLASRAGSAQQGAAQAAGHQASAGVYVVQPGDNLWAIAGKLGLSVDELKKKNGLSPKQARALKPGQKLATGS